MAPEAVQRQVTEECRIVNRPLQVGMTGSNPRELGNVIVVFSALPGEGESFTCVNQSLSLALERDRAVLLTNVDVAKPNLLQWKSPWARRTALGPHRTRNDR